jgi:hypothetical protein
MEHGGIQVRDRPSMILAIAAMAMRCTRVEVIFIHFSINRLNINDSEELKKLYKEI